MSRPLKFPNWRDEYNIWIGLMIFFAILILFTATPIITVSQHFYYKWKVTQEPTRYSYCQMCGYAKPHKIMNEVKTGVWVCDESECQNAWGRSGKKI